MLIRRVDLGASCFIRSKSQGGISAINALDIHIYRTRLVRDRDVRIAMGRVLYATACSGVGMAIAIGVDAYAYALRTFPVAS